MLPLGWWLPTGVRAGELLHLSREHRMHGPLLAAHGEEGLHDDAISDISSTLVEFKNHCLLQPREPTSSSSPIARMVNEREGGRPGRRARKKRRIRKGEKEKKHAKEEEEEGREEAESGPFLQGIANGGRPKERKNGGVDSGTPKD